MYYSKKTIKYTDVSYTDANIKLEAVYNRTTGSPEIQLSVQGKSVEHPEIGLLNVSVLNMSPEYAEGLMEDLKKTIEITKKRRQK